jgi:hypothetical protein
MDALRDGLITMIFRQKLKFVFSKSIRTDGQKKFGSINQKTFMSEIAQFRDQVPMKTDGKLQYIH